VSAPFYVEPALRCCHWSCSQRSWCLFRYRKLWSTTRYSRANTIGFIFHEAIRPAFQFSSIKDDATQSEGVPRGFRCRAGCGTLGTSKQRHASRYGIIAIEIAQLATTNAKCLSSAHGRACISACCLLRRQSRPTGYRGIAVLSETTTRSHVKRWPSPAPNLKDLLSSAKNR